MRDGACVKLVEDAIREIQKARRKSRGKKVREHLDRALALLNEVHHSLTTQERRQIASTI